MTAKSKGIWKNIMSVANHTHQNSMLPRDVICRKVGSGKETRLWKDTWFDNQALASRFNQLFALELEKDCSIQDRRLDTSWTWNWRRALTDG